MLRRFGFASGLAVLSLAALVAQSPPQQPPPFRAGVTLVNVDAYPRRNGRLIEGLRKEDFQVFEDGKPQAIEAFEFIRIESNVPDAERRDPTTKEEGEEQAKDPHSRVFVVYLDTLHTAYASALEVKRPLLEFLTRAIGPKDLFGVMTRELPVGQLVLGRRTDTFEADLANDLFDWNPVRGDLPRTPDEEQIYSSCRNGPEIIRVRREDQFLTSLEDLMTYLGALRDERKDLLLVSGGWLPDVEEAAVRSAGRGATKTGTPTPPPPPRVTPRGTVGIEPIPGTSNESWCVQQASRSNVDYQERFKNLLTRAQQANVSFYPVDAGGLRTPATPGTFGGPVGGPLPPTNKGPVAIARANPTMMGTGTRQIEVLRTLADNTDGRVVVNTNDLGAGFRQIADDLSAYYLLGYASTNPALDGKFRQIEVKLVDQPRLSVSARKGYLAAAPRASSMPSTAPDDVSEALARLPRPGDNDASALRPASGPHVFVGDPAAYRGAASPRIPLQPAPGFVFRRTERLHVEWPALKAVDEHIARLLDRNGRPLPLVVALTVQADKIAADLNLAPLGEGDYVIELTAGANGQVEKQLLAFRVVR